MLIDAFVIMPNHLHGVLIHTPEDEGIPMVGAQRDGSRPISSGDTLRPSMDTQPCVSGKASSDRGQGDGPRIRFPERAQRDGSGMMLMDDSLRPYMGSRPRVAPGSLGAVVRAFKASTTLRYHATRGTGPGPLWQRNYYEHIVRGQADLDRICAYILANPIQWELDDENPEQFRGIVADLGEY